MAKITTSNLNNTLNSRITAGETALATVANVVSLAITSVQIANSSYAVLDDTAANTSGTTYLVVNGSGFTSDCIVIVGNTNASSTTFANSKQLRAAVAAQNAASYPVYVTDIATGATATKINGLTFSSFPVWGTATALANVLSNTVFSTLLSANSDSSIIYSNTTILPTGTALLSNGYFYGNISIGAATTYSFDVKATDAELQDQTRTFSLSALNVPPTYTVEYLVVAGGGCGGDGDSGGGGAGGMLTGTMTANTGSSYNITIGSGAAGVGNSGGRGPAGIGGNSQIAAPTVPSFTAKIAYGGGAGGGYNQGGTPGGSGGGASNTRGGQGNGVPGQGYPGGGQPGGGGGGAAGAGSGGGGYGSTQPGGAGALWPYTNTYYAGGGGDGMGGNGGIGGGGKGDGPSSGFGPTGKNGAPGTGGGGGGTRGSGGTGGSGGDGVVILAVPTASYPGSAPGATVTTPPAAPGKTVLTFNSPGTYTA